MNNTPSLTLDDRRQSSKGAVAPPRSLSDGPPLLLTVKQVAKLLQINLNLVYQLIHSNELASITIGRTRRIPLTAVETFIARRMGM